MIDSKYYTCSYCHKDYEPKRRRVQKYCSSTCRSKAHHARTTATTNLVTKKQEVESKFLRPKDMPKHQPMSLAGIGNATAGSLAADAIKSLATPLDNKPATKGDLRKLAAEINGQYHLIKNLPPRNYDGALPYFDLETNNIVYFNAYIQ